MRPTGRLQRVNLEEARIMCIFKLFAAAVALTAPFVGTAATSFTADGKWGSVSEMTQYASAEDTKLSSSTICSENFKCTPSNLTWIPNSPTLYYDSENACEGLIKKGITTIFFHGDSYMRQIYAGMLITLNGDYRYGSLANSTQSGHCAYHRQFYEKKCGTLSMNHHGLVGDATDYF